jgi:hypothetical protein
MQVFTSMLHLIKPWEKRASYYLLDKRLCALSCRGRIGKGKKDAPARNWTVDIQLTAYHMTEQLQPILISPTDSATCSDYDSISELQHDVAAP